MTSARRSTHSLARLAIACLGLAGAAACLLGGLGAGLEFDLRTGRDGLRSRPASGDIVVVEMDKGSIDAFGRWPWPRAEHGRLVDRLVAAGARSIAFDVDFSSPSNPADDAAFAAALARSGGKVVLATLKQSKGSGSEELVESTPIPAFREQVFVGTVHTIPDDDGQVRFLPLGLEIDGATRPSLAAMVAESTASGDDFYRVDYAIDPLSIPRLSFADVVSGRVPSERIRGKRLVIGATAVEIGDRYAVPGHGVIPGVLIQALGAETLANGIPEEWGPLPPLLLALAGGLALLARRRVVKIAGYGGSGVAVLALPFFLESWAGGTVEIVPALAALAASGMAAAVAHLRTTLRIRAITDAATGLPNALALEHRQDGDAPCFLAVGVIDDFGSIASAIGPEKAAELVRRIAERLELGSRGSAIYRIDEGALGWVLGRDDGDDIGDQFDSLAAMMRAPVEVGGRRVDAGMHFGVASGTEAQARALATNAAGAARQAAADGKRWHFFVASNLDEAAWRLSLLGELDDALANGDVWIAHQPKLDIRSGRIVATEALVRWQHPERGPIPPDLFIPVVESAGRIGELTDHVLRTALADAARFRTEDLPLNVAVNMSVTLLTQPGLARGVLDAVAAAGVAPDVLTLEVTESAAMTGSDTAIATLEQLRDAGVRLSVDDYGTGQSTLTYLKRLPAREVKIDQSFVKPIATSRNDAILVRSTVDLAHQLGLKVVAEGVEDAACLALLAEMGCDTAQGWHIGKPMRAEDLLGHARAWNEEDRRAA